MTAFERDGLPHHWLIDSCGWLDFFGQTQRWERFRTYIEALDSGIHFTSPIVLFEVYRRVYLSGFLAEAREAVDHISHYCTVIPLTPELAVKAAAISCQEKLAMADSIILATAREAGATLVTSDGDLRGKQDVDFVE